MLWYEPRRGGKKVMLTNSISKSKHNTETAKTRARNHYNQPTPIYTPRSAKPTRGVAMIQKLVSGSCHKQSEEQADNKEQGQNRANKQNDI